MAKLIIKKKQAMIFMFVESFETLMILIEIDRVASFNERRASCCFAFCSFQASRAHRASICNNKSISREHKIKIKCMPTRHSSIIHIINNLKHERLDLFEINIK